MSETTSGFCVWITGLLFSGKKALAAQLQSRLQAIDLSSEVLEGGQLRRRFEDRLGFTREQVDHNLRRICFEAELLVDAGEVAIVAAISPFRDQRAACRARIDRFIEVYCRCPLDVLEQRDTIGFYAQARAGELENVAGVSFPYEEPAAAEVVHETDRETPLQGAQRVLAVAEARGFIQPATRSILTVPEEEALRRRLRDSWSR